ncbi:MAG: RNA-binding transcriptional accessory protein [Sphingobacteriales bacterium]|nr:MAG: RNA-binding transcriptional accessory protein [Sphingobacteriales bacterium]
MTEKIVQQLAKQLNLSLKQVAAVILLLDEGATIPFIARYRKELTGSLDEVQIAAIRDGLQKLRELEQRREYVLQTIEAQGKLTPELSEAITKADNMAALEDLYLPFKPKRRTRAVVAREKGLEPLAQAIMEQKNLDPVKLAAGYVDESKEIFTPLEALAGARDIIAEVISEHAGARALIRRLFVNTGLMVSKVIKDKETEAAKFKDYFDWSEPLRNIPSHRFLAMMRGEAEDLLRVHIEPDAERAVAILEKTFVVSSNLCGDQVRMAVHDAWKRLMKYSLEAEVRNEAKAKADVEAIHVFTDNLRHLLMAPPLGAKNILGIDPGFRTGCKVVCLNKEGKLLQDTTIFPFEKSPAKRYETVSILTDLCEKYKIEAIAIGNGTGGRETEAFVQSLQLPDIQIVMVNESGASVYSASEVAREEFPDKDITVRGAVSIARRLMDPLAELVRIDPKSIGVGQYQHDVDQNLLKQSLDDVVISCVNSVGVNINTASKQLLTYVSGLGNKLAQNIIDYRNQNGAFTQKITLKKVPGIGPKAFEQAAGFIRIPDAVNPLDAGAVHPESFSIVEKMAKDNQCTVLDLVKKRELREKVNLKIYITEQVGLPTLNDIMEELAKPGRDPRSEFEQVSFSEGINSIEDLSVGMILNGIITNVTNFGAFVDIGVHQDGMVHVSEIANKFIKDPKTELRVQQIVKVKVLHIDLTRKRIQLSIKQAL